MSIALYMDVHVQQAITDQLRRRQVDVLTAIEDGFATASDRELLERATQLGRVIFTQDIRFKALAENCQRMGVNFSGLIFGHQRSGSIGQFVADLELIAKITDITDRLNTIEYIPF